MSQASRQHLEESIVGTSQAAKAASHDRILDIAAARIRRDGIDRLAVAELMKEAGLTHGGFYRHFESREHLVSRGRAAGPEAGQRMPTIAVRASSAEPRGYTDARRRLPECAGTGIIPSPAAASPASPSDAARAGGPSPGLPTPAR
jgi:hypothetical protein